MATIANIVLKDGLAANVTFAPIGRVAPTEQVRYRASGVSVEASRVLLTNINSKGAVDRITGKVTIPVYDAPTDGTAPTLLYTLVGSVDFSCPVKATEAQRKDIRSFIADLCVNSQMIGMVDRGEHQLA